MPVPLASATTDRRLDKSRLAPSWGLLLLVPLLLAPPLGAQSAMTADGVIESTAGGFKFPDGTVQSTAADACQTLDPSDEMIRVGGLCIDKYEASIWDAPVGGNQITGSIPCSADGQDCAGVIYARSVAGVEPRGFITWFQAQAALANSGKRLPSNAEWQMAVLGTPDGTDCNVENPVMIATTGLFSKCVSSWGIYDMVGNVLEWVADWAPASTACPGWGTFSDDFMCFSGASSTDEYPAALLRGGSAGSETNAGPFAVLATHWPYRSVQNFGFRGVQ